MNYILGGDCLQIGEKNLYKKACGKKSNEMVRPEGYQYYEWHYKKILQKEDKQQKDLAKLLEMIKTEQKIRGKEQKENMYSNSKHYKGTFYDYNLEWKNRVDQKVLEEKDMKNRIEEQYYQTFENRKDCVDRKEQSLFGDHYKGPIEGWKEHFDNYLRAKADCITSAQDFSFEPKINSRSKKMTIGLKQKVQDRLLRYGEEMKRKHQEMQAVSNYNSQQKSFASRRSFVYERLYRQNEQINRRKQEDENNEPSFRPKTNKLSEEFESRVMMFRKPLYYIKNSLSQESMESNQQRQKIKGDFNGFLARNEALLNLKKKMQIAYQEQKTERQVAQRQKCTFSPVLNKKSRLMVEQKNQQNEKFCREAHQRIQSCPLHNTFINNQDIQPNQLSKISGEESDSLSGYYINSNLNNSNEQNTNSRKREIEQQIHSDRKNRFKTENKAVLMEESEEDDSIPIETDRKGFSNIFTTSAQISSRREVIAPKNNIQIHEQVEYVTHQDQKDSIDEAEDEEREWQSQLHNIENHLQEMMARAICLN